TPHREQGSNGGVSGSSGIWDANNIQSNSCAVAEAPLFKLYEKTITVCDLPPGGSDIEIAILRTRQAIFEAVAIVLNIERHALLPVCTGGSTSRLSGTDACRLSAAAGDASNLSETKVLDRHTARRDIMPHQIVPLWVRYPTRDRLGIEAIDL